MGTNNTAVITTATRDNILREIDAKGTSKAAVARDADIPMTTFDRKISDNPKYNFTIPELGDIAEALGIELADILPAALLTTKVAA